MAPPTCGSWSSSRSRRRTAIFSRRAFERSARLPGLAMRGRFTHLHRHWATDTSILTARDYWAVGRAESCRRPIKQERAGRSPGAPIAFEKKRVSVSRAAIGDACAPRPDPFASPSQWSGAAGEFERRGRGRGATRQLSARFEVRRLGRRGGVPGPDGARFAPAAGVAEIRRAPAGGEGRRPEGQPPGEAGAAAVNLSRGWVGEAPGSCPPSEERPRLWGSPSARPGAEGSGCRVANVPCPAPWTLLSFWVPRWRGLRSPSLPGAGGGVGRITAWACGAAAGASLRPERPRPGRRFPSLTRGAFLLTEKVHCTGLRFSGGMEKGRRGAAPRRTPRGPPAAPQAPPCRAQRCGVGPRRAAAPSPPPSRADSCGLWFVLVFFTPRSRKNRNNRVP